MFYVVVAGVNVLSTRSRCIFNAGQKSNIVVSETTEEEERQQQHQQQQRANPEASQIQHKPEY